MTTKRYNPEIHHRHTIRRQGYDYSSAGLYFVTVCTHEHEHLFGGITDNVMQLSDAGRVVETIWTGLPERFPMVTLDEFVVMPNHFHGIILLSDRRGEPCVRPDDHVGGRGEPCVRTNDQGDHKEGDHKDRPYGTSVNSLGRVMQAFKSITTVAYVAGVEQHGWPPFPGRLWQRNYYERIIRDERELNNIREYIVNNPALWRDDPENRSSETEQRP